RGQDTFEVAPHHLFLSYEDTGCSFTDTHKKMNPPLRSKSERLRLIQKFDMIPVIASDHAPHTEEEKYAEFSNAPSGVPGVETMLPLLMKEVFEGRFTLASVIEKTVTNPNTILGIESPGFIKGARADFAIYNPSPETIRGEKLHSKCGWTPYEGMHGLFPAATVVSGVLAWDGSEFSREGSEPV
ncbi:MAG TPA: dihydroorotase, partial [Methanocorpusculum sp.]|nr:dihydroorotase [Methanocorpusculum sp.]